MAIEVGKMYKHMSRGSIVKVVAVAGHSYSVIDIYDKDEKRFPAFSSELWPTNEEQYKADEAAMPSGHQTIMGSIAESWVNILVGFTINFCANMLILPMFGFHDLTLGKNFQIGMLYTVISLVRSFIIRRWFNGLKWGNK